MRYFNGLLEDYLMLAPTQKDFMQALWRFLVSRLAGQSFSTRFLHRSNPFVDSHELLDHETPRNLAKLLSSVRSGIEPFFTPTRRKKGLIRRLTSAFSPMDAAEWWRRFLASQAISPEGDASKAAVLLLHELKVRKCTVGCLYRQMQMHRTNNPQAALFLFDLDKAATEATFARV